MITTASSPGRRGFRDNRLLQSLAGLYAAVWLLAAIAPHDRLDWFLENLLVVGFVGLMVAGYRALPLSDLAYLLITLFLVLHSLGAHYTYSEVPLGHWLRDGLDLQRNPYDRIVHFSFGLLLVYALREVLMRTAKLRGVWALAVPFTGIMALSESYEIIEWLVAAIVSPEAAFAYLGTQGDPFDAQKDSALAALGAAVSLGAIALRSRLDRR